jgi:capsule polysaccharide export protein KpsC/LpsZ
MPSKLENLLDDQNFNHHFIELEEMANMLRETTTKERLHSWIQEWQSVTDVDGNHDVHNFPRVLDVSIVEDDTGIWVEKNMFMNKMRKIAIQVF